MIPSQSLSPHHIETKLGVGMSHEDDRVSGICFEEFMRSPNVACRKVTACLAASVPLGSSQEVPASASGCHWCQGAQSSEVQMHECP